MKYIALLLLVIFASCNFTINNPLENNCEKIYNTIKTTAPKDWEYNDLTDKFYVASDKRIILISRAGDVFINDDSTILLCQLNFSNRMTHMVINKYKEIKGFCRSCYGT